MLHSLLLLELPPQLLQSHHQVVQTLLVHHPMLPSLPKREGGRRVHLLNHVMLLGFCKLHMCLLSIPESAAGNIPSCILCVSCLLVTGVAVLTMFELFVCG